MLKLVQVFITLTLSFFYVISCDNNNSSNSATCAIDQTEDGSITVTCSDGTVVSVASGNPTGDQGPAGQSILAKKTDLLPNSNECPGGGAKIEFGYDDQIMNGILDDAEVIESMTIVFCDPLATCQKTQHLDNGLCVDDDNLSSCGKNAIDCNALTPPDHSTLFCNGETCDFLCKDEYHKRNGKCLSLFRCRAPNYCDKDILSGDTDYYDITDYMPFTSTEYCGDDPARFSAISQPMNVADLVYDRELSAYWSKRSLLYIDYDDAEEYCNNLGDGYRLPSYLEMRSLFLLESYGGGEIRIHPLFVDGDDAAVSWTSTPCPWNEHDKHSLGVRYRVNHPSSYYLTCGSWSGKTRCIRKAHR